MVLARLYKLARTVLVRVELLFVGDEDFLSSITIWSILHLLLGLDVYLQSVFDGKKTYSHFLESSPCRRP
jgi:hypothetical protein